MGIVRRLEDISAWATASGFANRLLLPTPRRGIMAFLGSATAQAGFRAGCCSSAWWKAGDANAAPDGSCG
jgi:hypothetical protein